MMSTMDTTQKERVKEKETAIVKARVKVWDTTMVRERVKDTAMKMIITEGGKVE